ncbi:hypothetical protein L0U88_18710 [Flavihumibacter sp. RY-1]|uniref:Uncharacterized protein n=1 Tax=Flavihumibacter fluminis TaxID=2909236 RepID=A0ABS9BMX5_9BACT|nr:hypothetical protein [Flavihumibacter fluminis]MCF1716680.1 hypothetical protein [Flavihumibacter fluminis]
MLFSYKVKLVAVLIGLLCIHFTGVSQISTSDCDEKPDSPKKLFVFIGELLKTETIPADVSTKNTKFIATYKIIERVCGTYIPDSITIEVIQAAYDPTFKPNRTHLVISIKDTTLNSPYYLWADLYYEVLKTANNKWAVPCIIKNHLHDHTVLNPPKYENIKFSNESYYNVNGLTQEDIDTTYPEFFFKIKNGKAFPKYGNTIDDIFELHKERTLTYAGIYDRTLTTEVFKYNDAEIEQIFSEKNKLYLDSLKNVYEKEFKEIRDSLIMFPFNENLIWKLISTCRVRSKYSYCHDYFGKLLDRYPDSINAYITLANFKHRHVSLEDTTRILLYKKALKLDSNNYLVNYVIAESYYNLFLKKMDPHFAFAARSSLIRCTEIDKKQLSTLKYLIIQLSNYLFDTSTAKTYSAFINDRDFRNSTTQDTTLYFPIDFFLNDITNWSTNYSINLLEELKLVTNRIKDYSSLLEWHNEPKFTNEYKESAYRLIWARRFHTPIVIRMEKKKKVLLFIGKNQTMMSQQIRTNQVCCFIKILAHDNGGNLKISWLKSTTGPCSSWIKVIYRMDPTGYWKLTSMVNIKLLSGKAA